MSAQLSRRTVLGAAGALGAVALVPRAAAPAVAGGHGGGVSATVNVTTYNIFSAAFDERFPNNTWASRRIAVGDIIRQRNNAPDVLAVQEGQVAQQVDELHQTLGGPYQHHTATADISPRSIVWKRSRFHAVEAGEFVVLGPEVEGHEVQRLGTQVRLRELRTRRELLVLNIHVPTGSSEELQRIRHDAATRIAAHAKAQSEEHGGIPVIVAGDFNNYYATVIGGIPSAPRTMTDLGLTETYAASPVESRLNPNIKSKNDIVNAMAGVGPDGSQRLDYIFTYPAARAEVLDWRMIVNFAPGTELGLRTPVPSDHHPTRSRLRLTWPG